MLLKILLKYVSSFMFVLSETNESCDTSSFFYEVKFQIHRTNKNECFPSIIIAIAIFPGIEIPSSFVLKKSQ